MYCMSNIREHVFSSVISAFKNTIDIKASISIMEQPNVYQEQRLVAPLPVERVVAPQLIYPVINTVHSPVSSSVPSN